MLKTKLVYLKNSILQHYNPILLNIGLYYFYNIEHFFLL